MSVDQAPNTKKVTVAFEVPREPSEYSAGVHFTQRLRERVPEELRDRVVSECIRHGVCRGTGEPQSTDDADDIKQWFQFDREVEGVEWRVIVGVKEAAFVEPEIKHLAVTVYAVGGGDE